MSRAWIAFYMGDYDKDTQDLSTLEHGAYFLLLKHCWVHGKVPLEPAKRANIARLTLKEWNKVAPAINVFFDEDGCNKRATQEIEKAEIIRTRRAIAGQRGGFASGISKAIARGEQSKREAKAKQRTEQISQQNPKPSVASHNSKIITPTGSEDTGEGLAREQAAPSRLALSPEALAAMGVRQ